MLLQKILITTTFAILLLATSTIAYAATDCSDNRPEVKVSVEINIGAVEINQDKSVDEIDVLSVKGKRGMMKPFSSKRGWHTQGITSSSIGTQISASTGILNYSRRNGEGCLYLKGVDVLISLEQTVFIASEYDDHSCEYEAILDHEMEHVDVNKEYVRDAEYEISSALEEEASDYFWYESDPHSKSKMKKMRGEVLGKIKKKLAEVMEEMQEEINEDQRDIDTLDEYERVARQCN